MRAATFILLLITSTSITAPPPPVRDEKKVVKRVVLPAGFVKWENIKAKDGMILRVTAGKVVVEGKRLFYGDGKVAMEVEAIDDGMEFVFAWGMEGGSETTGSISGGKRGFIIDGTHTDMTRMTWLVDPRCPTADKLRPGSIYLVTPSVTFKREVQTGIRLNKRN